jgi:hypothetical protein
MVAAREIEGIGINFGWWGDEYRREVAVGQGK